MGYLEKPWLKSYQLGPYKLDKSLQPYPREPVYRLLDRAAEKWPKQTAILFLERTLTYRDLKIITDRLARALRESGLEKGDRVCLFLPNCPEVIISDWAVMKAGGVVVPTSILRTEAGLIHEIQGSRCRVVVCREEHLDRILKIKGQCAFEQIIVTSTEGFDVKGVSAPLRSGVHEFRRLIDKGEGKPPSIDIDPTEDLCELAFTGGATGTPKGVMVTHYNRLSCILQGFPWMLKPMLRAVAGKSSILVPIPLFHAYGHYIYQSAAALGLRVILLPDPRDTGLIVRTIKQYRPLMIATVPTQLMRMVQTDIGKLNAIPISGSAPLPKEVADLIKKKMGTPVSEGYGLTETSPLTHFNISAFSKITGFLAKEKNGLGIPSPDTECRLIDPATGVEVPFGEPGEVVVRGPQIMKGYFPEPGSGLTPDGWLHTGDMAFMDEDGYFHLTDRIKDMVNISGLKVYTTSVDEVLFSHPGVGMAAAFGVPDPLIPGSERVMAVIQLKEAYKGKVSSEAIQKFCRLHLPPYAVPKFIEFRDGLPLTVTEKVYKKALRDEIITRMKAEEELTKPI
ncbi:MAG: AMP-binding protein [Deltaproteobacteria bacterium]|nr:AMP-binding protein [Deltaproteobacteria bacterium]